MPMGAVMPTSTPTLECRARPPKDATAARSGRMRPWALTPQHAGVPSPTSEGREPPQLSGGCTPLGATRSRRRTQRRTGGRFLAPMPTSECQPDLRRPRGSGRCSPLRRRSRRRRSGALGAAFWLRCKRRNAEPDARRTRPRALRSIYSLGTGAAAVDGAAAQLGPLSGSDGDLEAHETDEPPEIGTMGCKPRVTS